MVFDTTLKTSAYEKNVESGILGGIQWSVGMSLIHNEVLYRPKWVHGSILSLDYN